MILIWNGAGLNLLLQELENLYQQLQGEEEAGDLQAYIMQLKEFSHKAFTIFEEEIHRDDRLLWVNTNHRQTNEICSSLIQIENELDNGIYQHLSSLIMVSATMAVEDSFDHIIRRSGLIRYQEEGRIHTLLSIHPSYQEQACLLMVEDMVYPSHQEYVYQ